MILVDTSVWIDFLRGIDSPERRVLHRLLDDEGDLALTGVILTEVLQGIRRERDFRRVKESLLEFPLHDPLGPATWLGAAEIYRACRRRGRTVRKTIDCLIAAVCLENDLMLLHRDGDFDAIERCTGLRVLHA